MKAKRQYKKKELFLYLHLKAVTNFMQTSTELLRKKPRQKEAPNQRGYQPASRRGKNLNCEGVLYGGFTSIMLAHRANINK